MGDGGSVQEFASALSELEEYRGVLRLPRSAVHCRHSECWSAKPHLGTQIRNRFEFGLLRESILVGSIKGVAFWITRGWLGELRV